MISALLLSRVLWPRLRFLLARFSFADKCTFFLASFPSLLSFAHSPIQSKQHSYDVRLFYCSRKKQTFCCFFCFKKKRKLFYIFAWVWPRGGGGCLYFASEYRPSLKNAAFHFKFFSPFFVAFFCR